MQKPALIEGMNTFSPPHCTPLYLYWSSASPGGFTFLIIFLQLWPSIWWRCTTKHHLRQCQVDFTKCSEWPECYSVRVWTHWSWWVKRGFISPGHAVASRCNLYQFLNAGDEAMQGSGHSHWLIALYLHFSCSLVRYNIRTCFSSYSDCLRPVRVKINLNERTVEKCVWQNDIICQN